MEILQAKKPTVPVSSDNIEISSSEIATIEIPANDVVINIL